MNAGQPLGFVRHLEVLWLVSSYLPLAVKGLKILMNAGRIMR